MPVLYLAVETDQVQMTDASTQYDPPCQPEAVTCSTPNVSPIKRNTLLDSPTCPAMDNSYEPCETSLEEAEEEDLTEDNE